MARSLEEIEKEGKDIAKKLGNGVRYLGPQTIIRKSPYHQFKDDIAVTGNGFSGRTFEEAKEKFIRSRELFNALPPIFLNIPIR